jgi:hypothetical protein
MGEKYTSVVSRAGTSTLMGEKVRAFVYTAVTFGLILDKKNCRCVVVQKEITTNILRHIPFRYITMKFHKILSLFV